MQHWPHILITILAMLVAYAIGYARGSVKSVKDFHRFITYVDTILETLGVHIPHDTDK